MTDKTQKSIDVIHYDHVVHPCKINRVVKEGFRINPVSFGTKDMVISSSASANHLGRFVLGPCGMLLFFEFVHADLVAGPDSHSFHVRPKSWICHTINHSKIHRQEKLLPKLYQHPPVGVFFVVFLLSTRALYKAPIVRGYCLQGMLIGGF